MLVNCTFTLGTWTQ